MILLEFSDNQDSDASDKTNDIQVGYSLTFQKFSIGILTEKIELGVAENCKFEYHAEPIWTALLDVLHCHKSDAWMKTKGFSTGTSTVKENFSMQTLFGEIIPVVTEKLGLENRDKSIFSKFPDISDYLNHDGKIRELGFSIGSSSTGVILLAATLKEEKKLIVIGKKECENRQKTKHKAFFITLWLSEF